MAASKIPRALNLGNALVLLGVVALGLSFWIPYATGGAVARVEKRAEKLARALCDTAKATPSLDLADPESSARILATLSVKRLEPRAAPGALPGKALLFQGKHYLYMLTRTPREQGHSRNRSMPGSAPAQQPTAARAWRWWWRFADTTPVAPPPFEVYAWPIALLGRGRTVFFTPSDGKAAFCRNLEAFYHGLHDHPHPGAGRQQRQGRSRHGMLKWYRGRDDQRWILQRSDDDG